MCLLMTRLRRSVGIRPLNTSSTSYGENKDNDPAPPQLKVKEDAHKDSDSLATPTDQAKVEMAVECEGTILPDNAPPPPQLKDKEDAHKDSDSLATPTDQGKVEMAAECEGTILPDNAPPPPQLNVKEDAHKDSDSLATPADQGKVEMAAECEGTILPDNAPPPPQLKVKEDAHKDGDSLETPTDQAKVEMAAECEGTNLTEQGGTLSKTPLKTEEGNQPKTEEKQPRVKTGKESLLDLLVAMKVDVTSKKRSKGTKILARHEPTVTPKPAAMESTHSMFQKATVEASIQR